MTKRKIKKCQAAPRRQRKPVEDRWQVFAREYVLRRNAARAYVAAGYQAKNPDVAKACGSRLLARANVATLVAQLEAELRAKYADTVENIVTTTARIALSDPRRLFGPDGMLLPPDEWPDEIAAAVASVEVLEEYGGRGQRRELVGHTKKVKLCDKNAALERLFKKYGLFDKDNAQKTGPIRDSLRAISADPRSSLQSMVVPDA